MLEHEGSGTVVTTESRSTGAITSAPVLWIAVSKTSC